MMWSLVTVLYFAAVNRLAELARGQGDDLNSVANCSVPPTWPLSSHCSIIAMMLQDIVKEALILPDW